MSTVQITNRRTGASFIVSRSALAKVLKELPRDQYARIKPNLRIVVADDQPALTDPEQIRAILLEMDPAVRAAGSVVEATEAVGLGPERRLGQTPGAPLVASMTGIGDLLAHNPDLMDVIISHAGGTLQSITIAKTLMGYKKIYRRRQEIMRQAMPMHDRLGNAPNLDTIHDPSLRSKYIELYLTGQPIPREVATWTIAQFWSSPYVYQWANPPATVDTVSERTFMAIALRGTNPTWADLEVDRLLFPPVLEDIVVLANFDDVFQVDPEARYMVAWEKLKEALAREEQARENAKMDPEHEANWARFLETEFPDIYQVYQRAQQIKARAFELEPVVKELLTYIQQHRLPMTDDKHTDRVYFHAFGPRSTVAEYKELQKEVRGQIEEGLKLPGQIIAAVDQKRDVEAAEVELAKLEDLIQRASRLKSGLEQFFKEDARLKAEEAERERLRKQARE